MSIDSTNAVRYQTSSTHFDDSSLTEFDGDVGASVAAMMLLHAKETRDMTRDERAAEERTLQAEEAKQVQAIRDQAADVRLEGWEDGLSSIAAGGLDVMAGAATAGGSTLPSGGLTPGAEATVQYWKAAGEGVKALGGLASSQTRGAQKDSEADQTAANNRAEAAKRELGDIEDAAKDAKDLARGAIDFYRELTHTEAEGDRAAVSMRV